ncbi:RNA-binding protein [Alkalilimnicola ehrlichii]|uniref:RNA-binding protein n=1 Tax=Alkalilimnicola ehrlichii TaxID=351052 RepID=A0A3E0X152_9GAMM|nr:ribosome assembly RNA-binding protein YhbY [Alkalilimnicola ehrlichii]RFA30610.1 RNA-binding protein [Alkalilimnicola ehrlichii]RFA38161.1 RNA-binding protein [Alkalilimnicola ehrlichii]
MKLTEQQKRHLRRLGHQLKPVVRTGNAGLSEAVMNEIEAALEHHELIKVKLVADDREQRKQFSERICQTTQAVIVQAIGQIVLLYRPNPERKGKQIALP